MSATYRKKALVIAVGDYDKLDKLDFCKNDGEEICKVLESVGFQVAGKIVGKVSYNEMRLTMIKFFRDVDIKSDDTILFYYAGHGDISNDGGKFFCPSNYDREIPENDGIEFDFLTRMMNVCNSQKKIAIIDSCYSGALVPGRVGMGSDDDTTVTNIRKGLEEQFENSLGQVILASSMGTHKSFSHPNQPYSTFSYYLIEGLKGKAMNQEGSITVDTLYNYIFEEFDKSDLLKEQRPVRNGSVVGELLLASYSPENKTHSVIDQRSLAVGLIKHNSGQKATGFLIGKNIVMTDKSILPTRESASSLSIEFDFLAPQEFMSQNKSFELDPSKIFLTSELGYSIVSTTGNPSEYFGWIPFLSYSRALQPKRLLHSIYYTQHNKTIDQTQNILLDDEGNENKIVFESEANEISTGAPIFDTNWNLLAIHGGYDSGKLPEFEHTENLIHETKRSKRKLEGIRMIAIRRELENLCKLEGDQNACDIIYILSG